MNATLRLPKERLDSLEPAAVEAYLLVHGWEADPKASSRDVGVYHQAGEAEAEILLPRNKGFIDYALRMSEVLQELATGQQRTAWQVLEDLFTDAAGPAVNGSATGQNGAGVNPSARSG